MTKTSKNPCLLELACEFLIKEFCQIDLSSVKTCPCACLIEKLAKEFRNQVHNVRTLGLGYSAVQSIAPSKISQGMFWVNLMQLSVRFFTFSFSVLLLFDQYLQHRFSSKYTTFLISLCHEKIISLGSGEYYDQSQNYKSTVIKKYPQKLIRFLIKANLIPPAQVVHLENQPNRP